MGDDYELLFAAPPDARAAITAAAATARVPVARIGRLPDAPGRTIGGKPFPGQSGYLHV
jgi:thiamine monophosphate kinase